LTQDDLVGALRDKFGKEVRQIGLTQDAF
jgi:hypothetical protein